MFAGVAHHHKALPIDLGFVGLVHHLVSVDGDSSFLLDVSSLQEEVGDGSGHGGALVG